MAHIIEFKTAKFDPVKEPPNPINPIAGQSVLAWLRQTALPTATVPEYEDWGWYMEVELEGVGYLVGSVCYDAEEGSAGADRDWLIQIHKNRSLLEKILGRNKLKANDPLVAKVVSALRSEPAIHCMQETVDIYDKV